MVCLTKVFDWAPRHVKSFYKLMAFPPEQFQFSKTLHACWMRHTAGLHYQMKPEQLQLWPVVKIYISHRIHLSQGLLPPNRCFHFSYFMILFLPTWDSSWIYPLSTGGFTTGQRGCCSDHSHTLSTLSFYAAHWSSPYIRSEETKQLLFLAHMPTFFLILQIWRPIAEALNERDDT